MIKDVNKAYAYITVNDRLLLFRQVGAPDAGIQVPGGTIEEGEDPYDAVLREAEEETGIPNFRVVQFLGETSRKMQDYQLDEIHHRHFYHLQAPDPLPETWRHFEPDPSIKNVPLYPFEYFWGSMPKDVPELIAGLDQMLPVLYKNLELR